MEQGNAMGRELRVAGSADACSGGYAPTRLFVFIVKYSRVTLRLIQRMEKDLPWLTCNGKNYGHCMSME